MVMARCGNFLDRLQKNENKSTTSLLICGKGALHCDLLKSEVVIKHFQEQPDKEALDDDEDRKNPAYIPRKGAFYEHDTRLGDEGKEGEKSPEGRYVHSEVSPCVGSKKL